MAGINAGTSFSGHENRGIQAGQNFGLISGGDIHYYESSRARTGSNETRGPLYLLPFPRNLQFTGRTQELADLRRLLFVDGYCSQVSLTGLGGVGKTQVALELAYQVKATKPHCSIFWISAISTNVWQQAFVSIARLLGISSRASDGATVEANVRDHLNRDAAGQWLMIVDNADSSEVVFRCDGGSSWSLDDFLPQSTQGSILFTTRTLELATQLSGSEVIKLDEMSETVAYDLFSKALIEKGQLDEREVISTLLRDLTYLPLAITQAAAYINSTKISIFDYLSLLQDTEASRVAVFSREFHDRYRYKESKNPVAITWLISFDRIRRDNPLAADFLSFMSVLEPKDIPESLLPDTSKENKLYALGTLQGYSFITKRGSTPTYDLHRLVHIAAGTWLQAEGTVSQWRAEAIRRLITVFPNSSYDVQHSSSQLLPHAQRLLDAEGENNQYERASLCAKIGNALHIHGRYTEAINRFKELESWAASSLAEDSPGRLDAQHQLARAYCSNGQVRLALELLELVVKIRDGKLAEDHPDRLHSQRELARAYRDNGQVPQAIELLEPIVRISNATLAEKDHNRLQSQYQLALAYAENGQIQQAIDLQEPVVKIFNAARAEDDFDRLASQMELARMYQQNGQVGKATKLLEHIVKIEEATLAENHPKRLTSQYELALRYRQNGQVEKATELLEHVVKIDEATLAEHDPTRLTSQYELARMYTDNGEAQRAVQILEGIVKIEAVTLAEDDPERELSLRALRKARDKVARQTETSDVGL